MEGALPYPHKVRFLKWFIDKSKGQLCFVDDGKTGKVESILLDWHWLRKHPRKGFLTFPYPVA